MVENEPEDILYSVALFFEKQDGQTTRQRLFNCVVVAKDRDAALGKGISRAEYKCHSATILFSKCSRERPYPQTQLNNKERL